MNSDVKWSKSRKMTVNPGIKWYEIHLPPGISSSKTKEFVPVLLLKQKGEKLLNEDVERYKNNQVHSSNKRDFKWLQTVLLSGTIGDKIAAHIILVQESAVHNLSSVDMLLDLVNVKGKRECIMAMDALRDLFLADLLPDNRKLKKFEQQPLSCLDNIDDQDLKNQLLMCWYFEDRLKDRYSKFVNALETVSHDTVEKTKEKASATMYELLAAHPEQEQFLLQKLVNKLGDPIRKVASRVSYLLNQLVAQHPNMNACVVEEVERMMYRPNVGERAQYCALCFLNELILTPDDFALADRLVNLYFSFFKSLVKKGEVDTKIMKGLLVGVRRAYPFLKDKQDLLVERLEMMYQVVHLVSFNISIQALMLIFQVLESKHDLSDRFYNVLYRKILDKQFGHSPHQAMLFNLLYKALKKDHQVERVKAFVKRLLQICEYLQPQTVCGILILVSELQKNCPTLLDLSGTVNPALRDDDDDSEEHFEDLDDDETADQVSSNNRDENLSKNMGDSEHLMPSWVHVANQNERKQERHGYDPHHRNPLFARAGLNPFWELQCLSKHFHPTVSLFAKTLLNKKAIDYTGDPFQDFTLIHFLDRFVYRNPKKVIFSGDSQKVFGKKKHYIQFSARHIQPNTPQYLNQKLDNVPLEERFLFNYLRQKADEKPDDDSDIESVASEEFDQYLDKLEGNTDVNFADEFAAKKNEKKKAAVEDDDDDEEEEEEEDIVSEDEVVSDDEEVQFDDSELQDAFKDYDDDINEAFEDDETLVGMSKKSAGKKVGGKKRGREFDTSNLFASAEEFSHLLDENASSKVDTTSLEAMSNKDKASEKQLLWETQRNRWINNDDWKKNKRKKGQFKRKAKVSGSKKKMRK